MQNYKNYTIDYFSILLIPQSYELHKHVNTEEKFWCTYNIYIFSMFIKLKLRWLDYIASDSGKWEGECVHLKCSYRGWILNPPAFWNGMPSQ